MFDVSQIYRYSNCCVLGLGLELRYLMPLSTIFQLYREISFTDGGNQSTWRKPLIFHMLLSNLAHSKAYSIQHYVIKFVSNQSSRNVSVLSDMTSKIWADFAKD
jgi:hypothetical protein